MNTNKIDDSCSDSTSLKRKIFLETNNGKRVKKSIPKLSVLERQKILFFTKQTHENQSLGYGAPRSESWINGVVKFMDDPTITADVVTHWLDNEPSLIEIAPNRVATRSRSATPSSGHGDIPKAFSKAPSYEPHYSASWYDFFKSDTISPASLSKEIPKPEVIGDSIPSVPLNTEDICPEIEEERNGPELQMEDNYQEMQSDDANQQIELAIVDQQIQPDDQDIQPNVQQIQPDDQEIQPNVQQIQPDDQVQPDDQQVQPDDQQVQPDDQQVQPDDQQVQPLVQQIQPDDQKIQPNDQEIQPNDQEIQPEDQEIQPVDQQIQADDQEIQHDDQQMLPEHPHQRAFLPAIIEDVNQLMGSQDFFRYPPGPIRFDLLRACFANNNPALAHEIIRNLEDLYYRMLNAVEQLKNAGSNRGDRPQGN